MKVYSLKENPMKPTLIKDDLHFLESEASSVGALDALQAIKMSEKFIMISYYSMMAVFNAKHLNIK